MATDDAVQVLDRQELNRALLARQLLLRRSATGEAAALEHLVGLQAQVPTNPYVALWSRLENFDPARVSDLISDRRAVRIAVMRSTIHLVTAADCPALRRFAQPALDRDLFKNGTHGPAVRGLDLDALVAEAHTLLEAEPLTPGELGKRLQESRPERKPESLAYAVRNLVPLVQVPPRGTWGGSGKPMHTTAASWLGTPGSASVDGEPASGAGEGAEQATMIRRCLAAFGPATVQDVQTWSGLTRLGEVFEELRPHLVTFRDERGRELFDLPGAPRPAPDTSAPPRFLPEYDNIFLSHENRDRIIPDGLSFTEYAKKWGFFMSARGGLLRGNLLVDGRLRGVWRMTRERRAYTLYVEPFVRLSTRAAEELEAEGERLLAFAAEKADSRQVEIAEGP